MSEKMRAMLDRAVEQANQRMTAIQRGEFHPKIDVIRQGGRVDSSADTYRTVA